MHAAGIDDLVAVHLAAAAFDLVLGMERQLRVCGCRSRSAIPLIVVGRCAPPQDLTTGPFSGKRDGRDVLAARPSRVSRPWSGASSSAASRSPRSSIPLHYVADLGETAEFVLAAIALIPLAWLIGEATEHAAEHTGPGIGGFLNATFGNAPELIIALIAVHEGLTEVVRGSLTGSVIGNLLLVLGFSLLFGGRGELDRAFELLLARR